MYTEFYNLKEKPFNLSPSSKYLYLGDIHKEALALLTYGVIERMGFILLTGEVGTGKTTMVHALLNSLGDDVQYVYLSNPLFTVNEFMDYLAFSAFKKKVHFQSKADFLIQFESFLKQRLQHQKNFILIIDEAQKLSIDLLEEIRLLSNMETADEKLINIFLIGQPELNDTLNRMECRPLLQRISVRYHIKPLDLKGAGDYIYARLRMAGAEDGAKIFPRNTIKEIYKCSSGYPRMINIIADNMLLLGYSRGEKRLTPAMVKECYSDLQLSDSPLGKKERNDISAGNNEKIEQSRKKGNGWRLIYTTILVIIALFAGAYAKSIYSYLSGNDAVIESNEIKTQPPVHEEENIPAVDNIAQNDPDDVNSNENIPVRNQIAKTDNNDPGTEDSSLQDEEEIPDENNSEEKDEEIISPDSNQPSNDLTETPESYDKIITVKEGDTLAGLAMGVYGYANDSIFNLIQKNNPEIANIHIISEGQVIKFPPLNGFSSNQVYTVHIASFTPFENARELFNDLIGEGYEAYIMPVYNQSQKKIFRVTIGSFNNKQEASKYAREIKEKGVAGYTNVIRLETQ